MRPSPEQRPLKLHHDYGHPGPGPRFSYCRSERRGCGFQQVCGAHFNWLHSWAEGRILTCAKAIDVYSSTELRDLTGPLHHQVTTDPGGWPGRAASPRLPAQHTPSLPSSPRLSAPHTVCFGERYLFLVLYDLSFLANPSTHVVPSVWDCRILLVRQRPFMRMLPFPSSRARAEPSPTPRPGEAPFTVSTQLPAHSARCLLGGACGLPLTREHERCELTHLPCSWLPYRLAELLDELSARV